MLEFSRTPKDASDIHKFTKRKLVSAVCSVGNL